MPTRPLQVVHLGRRPYLEVEAMQVALRARLLEGDLDAAALLLVEHEPVVTLGRRTGEGALRVPEAALRQDGIAVHATSRGGEATYHGPGQLVAYPVVPLRSGIVAHVGALAAAAIATARAFGVAGTFARGRPGVWVGARKLASIGVHVHRRIAIHGLALNVTDAPLDGFRRIVPCGMPAVEMTALEREGARGATVADAAAIFADAFGAAWA